LDSLSWQSESPLWDLINKNNKQIPFYVDIALVSVAGGSTISNITPKVDSNLLTHKGNFHNYQLLTLNAIFSQNCLILNF